MAGEVDVGAMLRRITAKQFKEWEMYARLEPFGEFRADVRAASVAQMIFNMAVEAKDRRPLKDFLLDWEAEEKPKRPQTFEDQIAIAKIMAQGMAALKRENPGRQT